jgi:hypothetical protein
MVCPGYKKGAGGLKGPMTCMQVPYYLLIFPGDMTRSITGFLRSVFPLFGPGKPGLPKTL